MFATSFHSLHNFVTGILHCCSKHICSMLNIRSRWLIVNTLTKIIYRFSKLSRELNSALPIGKTKCMTISPNLLKCKLGLNNGIKIHWSVSYHLWKIEQRSPRRIMKPNGLDWCLKHTILHNKHLRQDTQARIYKLEGVYYIDILSKN